ncbi:6-phosphogluconolactonase [Methylophilaceae bacterium]|jgi:6-phosphogluconolactonase|nr:6-phosphogluconolactonase [Methylophilaceae bacterium]
MKPNNNIIRESFDEKSEFDDLAASLIIDLANKAINKKGFFSIVLCGGGTPKNIYSKLSYANTDWSAWYVYFGDERCLPIDHPERNSLMAQDSWLFKSEIPTAQVFPIPSELGNKKAAMQYENTIKKVEKFDLVLLGFGEDGHIASLFPGHTWDDDRLVVPVFNAPKLPSERVSLTTKGLSNAKDVIFLVAGKNKAKAFSLWGDTKITPASLITATNNVRILTFGIS